jgi:hypothetical protein
VMPVAVMLLAAVSCIAIKRRKRAGTPPEAEAAEVQPTSAQA